MVDAMSILWRHTNGSAKDRLPRAQFVPPSSVCFLRVPLQHAGEASALESRGAQMAGAPPVAERMEEASSCRATGKVRG